MSSTSAFNQKFESLLEFISSLFPGDSDILTAKNSLSSIRKINPKLIVKFWKEYIGEKYGYQIEKGDITFFIEKDYSSDVEGANASAIFSAINRLRDPIRKMNSENKIKTMEYLQILTRLSFNC